ncbi:MAG: sulfite exporter TauE/SafE family protein [Gordonibacter pamelaeae]|uniref:Probable membrane transporter protein n=2 Tax=Gordonibacter pamelaeae TaxID=471189 RepID=A0A369LWE8_9ACTN|nr:sulfite exporter TauE/SafE family protein [Gordonibacter pamelaeae]MBS4894808.1 sulfite exporter TauE/SafE family protein [Gordonibacter pamelaeae]MCQ4850061.1 sulfite exporter TauE/SafE family protein [Gordonibacter pamelaeae]RDB62959.1 sulfite exporter TauE/SafE family protein [Gordonibacter pamelaeae]HJH73553.1 sulfite exporter TauE/SafE family protein [Eggerthellaceae bacterium]
MDIFTSLVIPALVGIGIGILSGMLGIGGGTVLVPIFRLAFGMSPIMSTATSLFTIIPTSVSGAVSHIRHKTCVPSLGLAAGLGGACTSPIGVWLATISPAWMVMLAAALIIGYSAVNMLRKAWKMKPARAGVVAPAAPAGEPPVEAAVEQAGDAAANDDAAPEVPAGESSVAADTGKAFPKLTRKQLAIGAAIGLGAGLASGYVGVGGGFIMVPLMLSLVGISMKQASGTSLIAVMLLAIPGTIEQGLLGNIDYMAGIAVAVGSIPGAVIGARLVRLVPERTLRFIFGGFLIVAAVVLVLNEVGVL